MGIHLDDFRGNSFRIIVECGNCIPGNALAPRECRSASAGNMVELRVHLLSTTMNTVTANHSTTPALDLPSPTEYPEADVVLYDGQCKFCRAGVTRVQQLDGKNRLAFLSLHDPEVAQRWPDLTHEMLMREMYIIDRAGNRYPGAAAVRYLSRRLPLLWFASPFLHIPFSLPLWQVAYRWVAGMRYRWGKIDDCEDGACKVHFGKK